MTYCRTLDCIFDTQRDEGRDPGELPWSAIKVYRDGNPIMLGRFETEDAAEDFAHAEMARELADEGHGVGA